MNTTTDLANIKGGAILWTGNNLPPAAVATRLAEHINSRYQFISTKHVIEMMADEGFVVESTAVRRRAANPNLVPTDELLAVRRAGDDAGDLWSVFNRVQEATTRAQLNGRAATGRRIVTKPLLDVGPNMKYNAELWKLAEEFADH